METETRTRISETPLAPSDSELVRRVRSGDRHAYDRLVTTHRAVVFRVAARIVGADEADDVTQDSFVRAYYRLDQYHGDGPFRSWILQITRSVALNSLRKRRPDPTDEIPEVSDDSTTARRPWSTLEQKEQRERLEAKVLTLDPRHRAVLVLRDIEGLSYEEVATITETPIGSVKGRLHRARAEMIALLRDNSYDWELPAAD